MVYSIPSHHLPRSSSHARLHFSNFKWNEADWDGLSNYLLEMDYSMCHPPYVIDDSWSFLRDTILNACHLFIPSRSRKTNKHYPPWYTPIIHSINQIRSLRKHIKSKHPPALSLLDKLKSMETNVLNDISDAKEAYQYQLVSSFSNTPKILFRHLNNMVSSHSIPPVVHYCGIYHQDPAEKCELFNSFFNSTFLDPTHSLSSPYRPIHAEPLNLIDISEADVFEVLSSLDPCKSPGPDNISPHVLKHCALALTPPLHSLFVRSLQTGHLPSQWKVHLIVPIFKSGDRSDVSNTGLSLYYVLYQRSSKN